MRDPVKFSRAYETSAHDPKGDAVTHEFPNEAQFEKITEPDDILIEVLVR